MTRGHSDVPLEACRLTARLNLERLACELHRDLTVSEFSWAMHMAEALMLLCARRVQHPNPWLIGIRKPEK